MNKALTFLKQNEKKIKRLVREKVAFQTRQNRQNTEITD